MIPLMNVNGDDQEQQTDKILDLLSGGGFIRSLIYSLEPFMHAMIYYHAIELLFSSSDIKAIKKLSEYAMEK
jgi:hypothetical protein